MAVQPINNLINPVFRGSYTKTGNGNNYYKTNNGLIVGATWGGIGVIQSLFPRKSKIIALICLGMHSAIGSFIDYTRNEKAAEATDYIKQMGVKKAIENREDIYLSRNNGRPYYHSNVGAKYGPAIGAGVGAILSLLPKTTLHRKSKIDKFSRRPKVHFNLLQFCISTSVSALGGYLLGKITDYYTNKNAERNA